MRVVSRVSAHCVRDVVYDLMSCMKAVLLGQIGCYLVVIYTVIYVDNSRLDGSKH